MFQSRPALAPLHGVDIIFLSAYVACTMSPPPKKKIFLIRSFYFKIKYKPIADAMLIPYQFLFLGGI